MLKPKLAEVLKDLYVIGYEDGTRFEIFSDRDISDALTAILSAIKSELPKEKQYTNEVPEILKHREVDGYNQCLTDIKKLLE